MSIPKDGYYIALVQCDSGGEVGMHVQVCGGIPQTHRGQALLPSACSQFMEASTSEFCRVWSKDAALELDALRTANKALVESVKDRERERDHANDVADAVLRENAALQERVKRLEEAGSLALGYCAKGDLESADEVWGKAKKAKP